MRLTSEDEIRDRLLESYDPQYYDSIYRQMRYAFGKGYDTRESSGSMPRKFPVFPDIVVDMLQVGRSRRILNNLFIDLTRVRYSEIEPEFPEINDPILQEARTKFWLARANGYGHDGGAWTDHFDAAYFDGNAVGTGFVQVGLVKNPQSGKARVQVRHAPATQVLWDRHSRFASDARFVCFSQLIPADVAIRRFGEEARKHVRSYFDSPGVGTPLNAVRIFEYFDLGSDDVASTYAVIIDDLTGPVVKRQPMPFTCLPFGCYTHLQVPGLRRAIGRIVLQMATQEAINEIEAHLDSAVKQKPFTVLDTDLIEKIDLDRLVAGEDLPYVRMKKTPAGASGPPFYTVPGGQLSSIIGERFAILTSQMTADSGVTDFDRGSPTVQRRTATEVEMISQRSGSQGSWQMRQLARFMRQTVGVVLDIAKEYDRDPVKIDVSGVNLTINDPADPRLSLESLLAEPSSILVTEETLQSADGDAKKQKRLAQLQILAGDPAIEPRKLALEKLKVLGFEDREDWLVKA